MLKRFSELSGFPVFGAPRGFPVSALQREFDRLFGEAPAFNATQAPNVTFEDTGTALRLRAELPGLSDKDVDISVTANMLSLKAARKTETPEGYTAHRRERSSFSFIQSYELPARIDPEKVEASLRQGVLTLTLPKVAEAQPKKVTVTAAA